MKEKQRYVMTMIAVCGLVGASLGINLGSSGLFYNAISAYRDHVREQMGLDNVPAENMQRRGDGSNVYYARF